jgi:hypothetical protein
MKLFLNLLVLLSLLTTIVAGAQTITEDSFTISDFLLDDVNTPFVYEVTPDADSTVTFTLTGSSSYAPKIEIYDLLGETKNVPLYVQTAERGKTATITFMTRASKDAPITYTVNLITKGGMPGAEYTFTYVQIHQNDAGTGTDAPETFKESYPLTKTGTYEGFFGGADTVDFYNIDMKEGETITFTLTAAKQGTLGIIITDDAYQTKVDTGRFLDPAINDATLFGSFTSLRDQNVKININGDIPYTLMYSSDRDEGTTSVDLESNPMPPPPVPITPPAPKPAVQEEKKEPKPQLSPDQKRSQIIVMIVAAVLGITLLTTLVILHFHKDKRNFLKAKEDLKKKKEGAQKEEDKKP